MVLKEPVESDHNIEKKGLFMKSRKGFLYLIAGISFIFITNCGHTLVTGSNGSGGDQGFITSQESSITVQAYCGGRDSLPTSSPQDLATLTKGNTDFACDLYEKLSSAGSGNVFFSPYSISIAFAMTWAGARGQTESEMASVLHFSLDQTKLHPAFNALDLALKAQAQKDSFELNIVNQLWGEKTYHFLPGYLKTVSVNYGASMRLLDFIQNPGPSRITINTWVSDHTHARIQDLIPQGVITSLTTLVLTNAIYFKAQWADTFQKQDSQNQTFYRDNDSMTALFMHKNGSYKYASNSDFSALEMPYKGGEISMLFILPEPGKIPAVESGLTSDFLAGVSSSLQKQSVAVAIPKFKFTTSSTSLRDILISLGMSAAFSDAADFSGIDGTRLLFIQDAIHKAFVAVDERGTEAAAATAVILGQKGGIVQPPIAFIANRPFIFLIRDNVTGSVLFIGKLASPVLGS
jgi:serpin B